VIETILGAAVDSVVPVGGGCIAQTFGIEAGGKRYFVKTGSDDFAPLFDAEAAGLQLLSSADTSLRIPTVVAQSAPDASESLLVLEWLEAGSMDDRSYAALGRGLAELHRMTSAAFGLERDNYIGSTPQTNRVGESWLEFFVQSRLDVQARLARDGGRWRSTWDAPMRNLRGHLDQILPTSPEVSLVHGDLWSGNVLALHGGGAALVDPAVYYAHREVDIAMTELFGRFGDAFYEAYEESWPLHRGYDERRTVYNLYHLLNHLNLFGGGYAASVDAALKRYV